MAASDEMTEKARFHARLPPAWMKESLTRRPAPSEDDAFDGYPLGGLPGGVDDGALAGRSAEPRVWVGTWFPCKQQERSGPLASGANMQPHQLEHRGPQRGRTILGGPLLVLPGSELDARGQRLVDAFPVNAPVTGLSHVGEDGVLLDGLDGIGVCLH